MLAEQKIDSLWVADRELLDDLNNIVNTRFEAHLSERAINDWVTGSPPVKGAFCPKRRFQYRGAVGCTHCVTMYIVRVSFPLVRVKGATLDRGRLDNLVSTGSDGFSRGSSVGRIGAQGSLIKVSNNGPCILQMRGRWLPYDIRRLTNFSRSADNAEWMHEMHSLPEVVYLGLYRGIITQTA